ncbi:ABC transporter permease [Gilliamella sp. W8126]|nr:ABC transporter permease [Gilliamella sp. W8126]MBI0037658.1 ABC transporter permease [Gilliamella sp. B14384G10]MBI0039653.1 ABC transporter permease [Gilliamella sp. B14384G7]MBI0051493.1 ABC transporter permease [Gilliamella sp. B14384G13]MBI0053945.1 ABC transporter permease [Gilliamella sp. B14384H2]
MSYHHTTITNNIIIRSFKNFITNNIGILIALLLISIILSFASPVFLSQENMLSVLRQVSTNMCLALGMTLIIILGGIDLSVGSIVAMAGTLTVGFISIGEMGIVPAILLGLFIGTLCGAANGVAIAYTGIPPFIVTLAMMMIARGVGYIYSGGQSIRIFDESFTSIGTGYLGMIPYPVIYMLVFIVVMLVVVNRTRLGTYIYALGGNREAARLSGIAIKRVEIIVYTIAGFLAAFAGIVLAARMYSGQPSVAQGYEMDAIAACVLGGISMSGGIGRISGTILGVIVIGIINNGLNLLGVNSFWQLVAKGVIIFLAVYVDMLKRKKAN